MAKTLSVKIKSLVTYPNNFGEVPDGALAVADNIDLSRPSIAETRRGQKKYGDPLLINPINGIRKLFQYKDTLLVNYNSFLAYDADHEGNWVAYSGSYSQPDADYRMRSAEANKNFYFTTDVGIKKLDRLVTTPVRAGQERGLGGYASLVGGGLGFLPAGENAAYKMTWAKTDYNKNLIEGFPSDRIEIGNASADPSDVNLRFYIPEDITVNDKYRIYRTKVTANTPDEDYWLVFEGNPTASDITNKYFDYEDTTVDALQGAMAYFSNSAEQLINGNLRPPFAKDIAYYKNNMFWANFKTPQTMKLQLLAVGGAFGLQLGDTITIAGVTYTAATFEDTTLCYFELVSGITPALDVSYTVQSLINIINTAPANTSVYAHQGVSTVGVGTLEIVERGVNGGEFYATSSKGEVFAPVLPASGTEVSSTNDDSPNGLAVSKYQQPESWPGGQVFYVGSADKPIQRIIALSDSLLIFKEDGVFRLTGDTFSSFTIDQLDTSARLLAPESAVVLNNQVYFFSDQGVLAISNGGTAIMSNYIDRTLLELIQYDNFSQVTFGVSYESDHKYILMTISNDLDEIATQGYVYNYLTSSWVRWYFLDDDGDVSGRTCGIIFSADNKLYMGGAG